MVSVTKPGLQVVALISQAVTKPDLEIVSGSKMVSVDKSETVAISSKGQ